MSGKASTYSCCGRSTDVEPEQAAPPAEARTASVHVGQVSTAAMEDMIDASSSLPRDTCAGDLWSKARAVARSTASTDCEHMSENLTMLSNTRLDPGRVLGLGPSMHGISSVRPSRKRARDTQGLGWDGEMTGAVDATCGQVARQLHRGHQPGRR